MANCYTQTVQSWTITDIMSAGKLFRGLNAWVKVIEDDKTELPIINIAGAPKSLYDALIDFRDTVLQEPDDFISTFQNFSIIEHDYELHFESHQATMSMVADILHLFILLEDDVAEWRITWADTADSFRDGPFTGGIVVVKPGSVEMYNVDDLYDRFRDIGIIDDRI